MSEGLHPAKLPPRLPLTLARIAALNVVVLLLLLALAEGIGEWYWLVFLFAYCPPILWTAATIALTLAALIRRDRAALGWCGVAWLVLIPVLGIHIPLRRPAARPDDLRVMTFNIESGAWGPERVVDTIRRSGADVVVLEEATGSRDGRPGFEGPDPLPFLRTALPEYHIARSGDVAIVTRLPLRGTHTVPLVSGRTTYAQESDRALLFGTVEWQGKPVTIAAAHITIPANGTVLTFGRGMPWFLHETAKTRHRQVDQLLEECSRASGPLIVLGDFNTPPHGPLYHRLTGHFRDSFAEVGFGPGWSYSTPRPCLRVDYVFTSADVLPVSCEVLQERASDHRPVMARLRVGDVDNR